jgi:hypothetical protein
VGGDDRAPFHIGSVLFRWAWSEQRSLIDGRVTLAGGSSDELGIKGYCDAAYAILIDEYQRRGITLDDALRDLREWATGIVEEEERVVHEQYQREYDEDLVARRNAEAMGAIDSMLLGT